MTRRLLAVACTVAVLLVRRALCGHPARQSRPYAVHPADGRRILHCHCPTCESDWTEYAP